MSTAACPSPWGACLLSFAAFWIAQRAAEVSALLVVFVSLSLRIADHARVESVWWVAAAAVWCEPEWTTLRYEQINLLLAVLVL